MTAAFFLWHFVLLYGAALAPAIWLARRLGLPAHTVGMLAVVVFGLAGYVDFFLWMWSPAIGFTFDVDALAAALYAGFRSWRSIRARGLDLDYSLPYALVAAVGLLYVGLLSLNSTGPLFNIPEAKYALPPDDGIPRMFADRLHDAADPRLLLGDWHSSDRPPLQTGIVLLQRAFEGATFWRDTGYEMLGLLCQLAWVAGLWTLCRALGLTARQSVLVVGLIGLTSFVFENSIFVWPKFLAASFALLAVSLAIGAFRQGRKLNRWETIVGTAAISLGTLSHGGVIFTLVPFVAWILIGPLRPGRRDLASAAAAGALILYPWWAYQHFYDPPGDRLIKYHLAGVQQIDPRPPLRAMVDQYRATGLQATVALKLTNLVVLEPRYDLDPAVWLPTNSGMAHTAIVDQFFYFFDSSDLLLLVGIVPLAFVLRRRDRAAAAYLALALLVFVSLAFWVLIMFGPHTTTSHQGSYANNFICAFVLSAAIVTTFEWLGWAMLAFEAVQLLLIVALVDPPGHPFNGAALIPMALGVCIFAYAVALTRARAAAQQPYEQVRGADDVGGLDGRDVGAQPVVSSP
jgi:hypothetical protein